METTSIIKKYPYNTNQRQKRDLTSKRPDRGTILGTTPR